MNPRFDPEIQEALEKFLKKYKCFREVFRQLSWIKSTDPMAVKNAAPCWVQYFKFKTYVVLNEELLLKPDLKDYISWCACHEILHVVKSHAFRFQELSKVISLKKERDLAYRVRNVPLVLFLDAKYEVLAKLWNMAADMSINSMFGYQETPPGCLLPGYFGLQNNLSAEDYFDILVKKAEKEHEDRKKSGKVGDSSEDCEFGKGMQRINSPKIVRVKVKKQKPSDPSEGSDEDDGEKSEGGDLDPSEKESSGNEESESSEGSSNKSEPGQGSDEELEGSSAENSDSEGSGSSDSDSSEGASGSPGGEGCDNSSGGDNSSSGGSKDDGSDEVDEVTPCTCGSSDRYTVGYRPCVHEIDVTPPETLNQREADSEEDMFDPGEALRQAMESSFKETVKKIKIKKQGEAAKSEDFDPNNYKQVLGASGVNGRYGGGKASGGLSDFECKILDTFNEVTPFKWERLLDSFLKTGSKVGIKSTRRKRDRRFGTRPGLQIFQKKHVAFVLDTSGSMSTEKIMSCKPMIDSLSKQMDVTLIQCDWEIRHCEKWTSRDFIELKGGGGTIFYPAIKVCEHLKVDGMVYYTDGLTNDSMRIQAMDKPAFDTLWLLVDVKDYGLQEVIKNLPNWGKKLIVS